MKKYEINGVVFHLYSAEAIATAEYESRGGWEGEMKRLAKAWIVDGDQMAGDIWSDLWKDEYGCRPRYTRDEIRELYGL